MLLQFQCKNHRSIKSEITFSMLASSDTSHEDKLIKILGKNNYISRCSAFYGANGSGKTSVLNALGVMKTLVIQSSSFLNESQIIRFPHKSALRESTKFCINFERNGLVFQYFFEYNDTAIINEELHYWPNGRDSKIFERSNIIENNEPTFKFFGDFKKIGENCRGRLKTYKLLLSIAFSETNIPEITEAFNFFNEDLIFLFPQSPNNWLSYSSDILEKDGDVRKTFLGFLNSIGSDVIGFSKLKEDRVLTENEILKFPVSMRKSIEGKVFHNEYFVLQYPKFQIKLEEESDGIKKLFSLICPLIDIIKKNKVFICDEIETSLHSSIILEIIRRFFNNEKSSAQMIFATHNTELLNLEIMRRDQIWFTELEPEDRKTDLYSLSDIKNVRKDECVKKGYIAGKYGAIPMINTAIKKICEEDNG